MSGDVEMVPAHSPSPDVSALVAAASRPVLEVPPESIAAALSALGEMAFGDSDDDDRDDVRRRVELALSTRFDSLLDTMLSIRGSTANESERVVLQATRAADVVARLARESGFRVLARSLSAMPQPSSRTESLSASPLRTTWQDTSTGLSVGENSMAFSSSF